MTGFAKGLIIFLAAALLPLAARAGLDLENQTEIPIGALDLDHDGRIQRREVAEYMFYYFDRDGNETLTNGEYGAERAVDVLPYEGDQITVIDLDNDGADDGVEYTKDAFLEKTMVGEYDPQAGTIVARNFLDIYFLKLDSDRSSAIELDEWQKAYDKHALIKPNRPTKAGENDRYTP